MREIMYERYFGIFSDGSLGPTGQLKGFPLYKRVGRLSKLNVFMLHELH